MVGERDGGSHDQVHGDQRKQAAHRSSSSLFQPVGMVVAVMVMMALMFASKAGSSGPSANSRQASAGCGLAAVGFGKSSCSGGTSVTSSNIAYAAASGTVRFAGMVACSASMSSRIAGHCCPGSINRMFDCFACSDSRSRCV